MIRRSFLAALAATVVSLVTGKRARATSHTDFDYADAFGGDVLSPSADPRPPGVFRRDHVVPYLNGKPVRLVQRASAAEGWMDVATRPFLGKFTRKYGRVQLLRATPERLAEFERTSY
jgi:hypothetical protein